MIWHRTHQVDQGAQVAQRLDGLLALGRVTRVGGQTSRDRFANQLGGHEWRGGAAIIIVIVVSSSGARSE